MCSLELSFLGACRAFKSLFSLHRLHSATTGGTGAGAADRKRKTSEKQQAMEVKARVQEEGQDKAVARSLLKTEGGPDNFFNFPPDSADIWSPNFTKSLRKTR